jgi:fluoride ion exporter CrcB/FEX
MALLTPTYLPEAAYARLLTTQVATTPGDSTIQGTLIANIVGSINAGVYGATISLAGSSASDIQYWANILNGLGYTTSFSSTSLTVAW